MTITPERVEAVCAELHSRDGWPPNGAGPSFQDAQRARVRRVLEADERLQEGAANAPTASISVDNEFAICKQ